MLLVDGSPSKSGPSSKVGVDSTMTAGSPVQARWAYRSAECSPSPSCCLGRRTARCAVYPSGRCPESVGNPTGAQRLASSASTHTIGRW